MAAESPNPGPNTCAVGPRPDRLRAALFDDDEISAQTNEG
jgi:hypothetical protein